MNSKPVFLAGLLILHCVIGSGQASFQQQVLDTSIQIGYGLALADVNGDGKTDILLADKKQFVWYRNGDWKKFILAENLTEHDNVCIAARDIDGDGKAEVAVGAQWNPGETSNDQESGAVFYLIRPDDPTQLWKAVRLHQEPTVHRMQWIPTQNGKYVLVMAPLHGRGNKNGEGAGSKILAYQVPANPENDWKVDTIEGDLHLTHNFFRFANSKKLDLLIAGKEGIIHLQENGKQAERKNLSLPGMNRGAGEITAGRLRGSKEFIGAIEPMHGNELTAYINENKERILLDSNLKEGHAIGVADFLHRGSDQLVAGWRNPNRDGKVGIKLYVPIEGTGKTWESFWVDENGMACEDLKIADLNGDGKPDIVASGRTTHNVKVYWGR